MEYITNSRKRTTRWDTVSQTQFVNTFTHVEHAFSEAESESDSIDTNRSNAQRHEWNQSRKRQRIDSDSEASASKSAPKISRRPSSSWSRSRSRSRSKSLSISRSRSRSRSKLSISKSRSRSRSLSVSRSRSRSRSKLSLSRSRSRSKSLSGSRSRSRSLSVNRSGSRSKTCSISRSRSRSQRSRTNAKRSRTFSRQRRRSRSKSRRSRSMSGRPRSISRNRRRSKSNLRRSRSISRRSVSLSTDSKRSWSIPRKRRRSRSSSISRRRSRSISRRSVSLSTDSKRSWSIPRKRRRSRSSSISRRRSRSISRRSVSLSTDSKRSWSIQRKRRRSRSSSISRRRSRSRNSSRSISRKSSRSISRKSSRSIDGKTVMTKAGETKLTSAVFSTSSEMTPSESDSSRTSESDSYPTGCTCVNHNRAFKSLLKNVDTELFPFVDHVDVHTFGKLLSRHDSVLSFQEHQKRELISHVLKIKNGPPEVAEIAVKCLQRLARRMDASILVNTLVKMLSPVVIDHGRKARLLGCVDAIVFKLGRKMKPYLQQVLVAVQAMALTQDTRRLAFRIQTRITKVVGMTSMIASLKENLDSADVYQRAMSCKILSVVTCVVGFEKMLPFLRSLITKVSPILRTSGIKITQMALPHLGDRARPFIPQIVKLLEPELCDNTSQQGPGSEVVNAVNAVVSIAQKSDEQLFNRIWSYLLSVYSTAKKLGSNENTLNAQNTLSRLLRLKSALTEEDLQDLETGLKADATGLVAGVNIMWTLSKCKLVSVTHYSTHFLQPFITKFITNENGLFDELKEKFLEVSLRSCRKLTFEVVIRYFLALFNHPSAHQIHVAGEAIAYILNHYDTKDLSYDMEKEILLSVCGAVKTQDPEADECLEAMLTVMKTMGNHLNFHTENIKQTLNFQPSSNHQRKLFEQIQRLLNGSSQSESSMLGLVTDGSVLSVRASV